MDLSSFLVILTFRNGFFIHQDVQQHFDSMPLPTTIYSPLLTSTVGAVLAHTPYHLVKYLGCVSKPDAWYEGKDLHALHDLCNMDSYLSDTSMVLFFASIYVIVLMRGMKCSLTKII